MIDERCECGAPMRQDESAINAAATCAGCGRTVWCVAAEALTAGAGAGDFDSRLVITDGPDRVGEIILLGGVPDIEIGKLPDKHILLAGGTMVSRFHAKLTRVDFGPSRWRIEDNRSTNGLLVNGLRVEGQELKAGDRIQIGNYHLVYQNTFAAAAPEPPLAKVAPGGPICPSCNRPQPPDAKICIPCGIYIATGRPLVMSKGMDEDDLAIRADTWIRTVSWIMRFGLFPIASEAFGSVKPRALWTIAVTTVVCSVIFFIGVHASSDGFGGPLANLMLWSGRDYEEQTGIDEVVPPPELVQELRDSDLEEMSDEEFERLVERYDVSDDELVAALQKVVEEKYAMPKKGFQPFQLATYALLHDPGGHAFFGLFALLFHLGGNMVFMLVFGLAVNELIGNVKMAIIYPIMAIVAGLAHMWASQASPLSPMLGASGAVMGLAGMYFIFFPTQKVRMAIWFRGGLLTGFQCWYKVFSLRGFWLLVFWIGLNDVFPVVLFSALDVEDAGGVAHRAHLGGFVSGMVFALVLLLGRLVNANGSDILSVTLGRHAWALIGKPTAGQQATREQQRPRAQSLSMP